MHQSQPKLKLKILNLRDNGSSDISINLKQPFNKENGLLFDNFPVIFQHNASLKSTCSNKTEFTIQKIIIPPNFSPKSSENTNLTCGTQYFFILSETGQLYQANLPETSSTNDVILERDTKVGFPEIENFVPSLFDTSPNPDIVIDDDKPLEYFTSELEIEKLVKVPLLIDIDFTASYELVSLSKDNKLLNHSEPDFTKFDVVATKVKRVWFSPFGVRVEYEPKAYIGKNYEFFPNEEFSDLCTEDATFPLDTSAEEMIENADMKNYIIDNNDLIDADNQPYDENLWRFSLNKEKCEVAVNKDGNLTVLMIERDKLYDRKNLVTNFDGDQKSQEKISSEKLYTVLKKKLVLDNQNDLIAIQWHCESEKNKFEMITQVDLDNKLKDKQLKKLKLAKPKNPSELVWISSEKNKLEFRSYSKTKDSDSQLKVGNYSKIRHSNDNNRLCRIDQTHSITFSSGKNRNEIVGYSRKIRDPVTDVCSTKTTRIVCQHLIKDIQVVGGYLFVLYEDKSPALQLLQLKCDLTTDIFGNGIFKMLHPIDVIEKEFAAMDLSNFEKPVFIKELMYSLNRQSVKKVSSQLQKTNKYASISDAKFNIFSSYFTKYGVLEEDFEVKKADRTKKRPQKSIIDVIIETEDFVVYRAILKSVKSLDPKYNKSMLEKLLEPKHSPASSSHSTKYRCLVFRDIFLQIKSSVQLKNTFFKIFQGYFQVQSHLRKELSYTRDVYQSKTLDERKCLKTVVKWNDYLENLEVVPSKAKFVSKFPYAATEICLRFRLLDIIHACDSDELIKFVLWLSTSPIFTEVVANSLTMYFPTSETYSDVKSTIASVKIYSKFTNAVSICYSSLLTLNSSKKGPLLHGYKTISSLQWSVLDGMVDGDFNNIQKICLKEMITKCVLLEKTHQKSNPQRTNQFISNIHPILKKLEFQAKDLATTILENSICSIWIQDHAELWHSAGLSPKNVQELKVDSVFSCKNIYNTNDVYFEDCKGFSTKLVGDDEKENWIVDNDISLGEWVKMTSGKMSKNTYKEVSKKLSESTHAQFGAIQLATGFHAIVSSIVDFSNNLKFDFKFDKLHDVWSSLSKIFSSIPTLQETSTKNLSRPKTESMTNNYLLNILGYKENILSKYSAVGHEHLIIMFDIMLYIRVTKKMKAVRGDLTRMYSSISDQNTKTFFKHSASVSDNFQMFKQNSNPNSFLQKIPEALPLAKENDLLKFAASKSDIFGKSGIDNPELEKFRACLAKFSKIPRFFIDLLNFSNYKYSVIYPMLDRNTKHIILQTRTSIRRGIRTGVTEYGLHLSKFFEIDRSNFVESVTKQVETLMKVSQAGRLNSAGTVFFVFEPNARQGNSAPYLDVSFKYEKGYGPGVDISFFKSFGEAFLQTDDFSLQKHGFKLPLLWMTESGDGYLPVLFKSMSSDEFEKRKKFLFSLGFAIGAAIYTRSETYNTDDTWQRCLGFRFSRPFAKLILGHEVRFHDLAFFDQDLFNSLRNLVHEVRVNSFNVSDLDDDFTIELGENECGEEHKLVELCENGADKKLTNQNLLEYVELFTKHRMVKIYKQAAQIVRDGIVSFVNPNREEVFFDDLSLLDAEDLSLIMCGEKEFDKESFKKTVYYTSENRKTVTVADNKEIFEKVIDQLSNQEMFDLWFFWTGRANYIGRPGRARHEVPTVIFRDPTGVQLPTAATKRFVELKNLNRVSKKRFF